MRMLEALLLALALSCGPSDRRIGGPATYLHECDGDFDCEGALTCMPAELIQGGQQDICTMTCQTIEDCPLWCNERVQCVSGVCAWPLGCS